MCFSTNSSTPRLISKFQFINDEFHFIESAIKGMNKFKKNASSKCKDIKNYSWGWITKLCMNPVKGSSWAFERLKHHTTYLLYKPRAQSSLRIQKQNFLITLAFWVLVQCIFYYCQREVIQKLEWGKFEVVLDRQENGGPCMSSRVWLFVTHGL